MTSKKEEVIQIAEDESVDSILKRLEKSVAEKIILFVPPNAYFFSSAENLKTIKEKIEAKGVEWFLLTDDKLGQKYAGILGIKLIGEIKKEHPSKKEILPKEKIMEIENFNKKGSSLGEWFSKFKHELPIKKYGKKEDIEEIFDEVKEEIEEEEKATSHSTKKGARKETEEDEEYETEEEILDYGPEPEEDEVAFRSLKKIVKSHENHFKKITIISFASAVVLLTIFVAIFVLPEATLEIKRKTTQLQMNFAIELNKNTSVIDAVKNTLPAQLIQIQKDVSKDFPVDNKQVLKAKAQGEIFIYNNYSSKPQTLVATTRFLAENGKLFRLVNKVIVPGASIENGKIIPRSIKATVVADQVGPEYNISPTKFSIPGFLGDPRYLGFYGISEKPMIGGANGQVNIVTKEFIDNCINSLKDDALKLAQTDLQNRITSDLTLIDGASKGRVVSAKSDVSAGESADSLHLTVTAEYDAIVFNMKDLKSLGVKLLEKNSPKDQEVIASATSLIPTVSNADFDKGVITLQLSAKTLTAKPIDKNEIRSKILGFKSSDVSNLFLQNDAVEEAKLTFWPFWVSSVPTNSSRVNVNVEPQ
jgi:hypothetical protein